MIKVCEVKGGHGFYGFWHGFFDGKNGLRVITRVAPAYNFHEAAKYLRLPVPTLRSWSIGHGKTEPVFKMDDPQRQYLSFMNLVEAHILAGIRRRHGVGLPQVR